MDKNKLWKWLLIGFLVVWSLTLTFPPFDKRNEQGAVVQKGKIKLGLDLKGGSSFVVEVDRADVLKNLIEDSEGLKAEDVSDSKLNDKVKEVQDMAVEVIRNRIDVLGTAEPEIYPEGDSRIVVLIPGAEAETRAEAKAQISRDAVLTFKLVHNESDQWAAALFAEGKAPEGFKPGGDNGGPFYLRDRSVPDEKLDRDYYEQLKTFGGRRAADFMLMQDSAPDGSAIYRPIFVERRIQLGGDKVKNAALDYDQLGQVRIALEFNKEGAKTFGRVTEAYSPRGSQNADSDIGRRMAIILDNKLYSAPVLKTPIYSGSGVIEGAFTIPEARKLVNALRAGALPGRVKIVEERTVDPTLGHDSIAGGIKAALYGSLAVFIWIAVYYMIPGLLADLSLIFVLLLLPVGMMVSAGFLGVLSGSLEGSAVTLPTLTLYGIAGIVLTVGMSVDANVLIYERMREESKLGKSLSGTITAGYTKAFSTILDSNLTTLLTAIIMFWQGSGPIRGFAVTLCAGIIVSMFSVLFITRLMFNSLADHTKLREFKMMSLIGKTNIDFLGKRMLVLGLSVAVIIGTWAYFFKKGDANFSVDFTGGTVMAFEFQQKQDMEAVRATLANVGFPSAKVNYQSSLDGKEFLEIKVSATGEESEPALTAVQSLPGEYKVVKNDSVGSQIGDELKSKGMRAMILAWIGIIIYISIRFEFSFAIGAIVALVHDVLITIGIFCALGHELSMPILAALLTIIGYSVNDTIVVFDRIREDLKFVQGKSYVEIANLSVNQTLSRTLLTGTSSFMAVIALMIWGGGAVYDFALTLFIGFAVGTFSSIYVATPIMLLWHKEKKV